MSKVCAIIVVNNSATAGEIMTVGAGSNPLLNWIIATGDGNKAGPGGAVVVIDESLRPTPSRRAPVTYCKSASPPAPTSATTSSSSAALNPRRQLLPNEQE
jgi:hypothetical protein